jgi:hypothetical protein
MQVAYLENGAAKHTAKHFKIIEPAAHDRVVYNQRDGIACVNYDCREMNAKPVINS